MDANETRLVAAINFNLRLITCLYDAALFSEFIETMFATRASNTYLD
jgi:hypothetical protein